MTRRARLPQSQFPRSGSDAHGLLPIGSWPRANRGFYDDFRAWLRAGGYGESALMLYSVAARLALGLLDRPYWMIDPESDPEQVREYIAAHYPSRGTQSSYHKGLAKLAEYLRIRNHRPAPEKPVNWDYYCGTLPRWLAEDIRAHVAHCQRSWRPEARRRATLALLSHLTGSLRWLAAHLELTTISDVTPEAWFEYVDARLEAGITARTLNGELHCLQHLLRFLVDQGRPVCARMLRVKDLAAHDPLPRDVPLDQLRCLQAEIEKDVAADHAGVRRMGLMDRAWFLLMLHSGLRTGEVRRLRLADLDLPAGRARIEQSKGLKDRIVYLSRPGAEAVQAYLAVRGPAETDHVFLFRHKPLSATYCLERLHTYGRRCGLHVTPHQLRHSCATLLLNAGTPILTVQAILGHKFIDTTLAYARLYDGTVAADYYRAMDGIEEQSALGESAEVSQCDPGHLLAMVDALSNGTLNENQRETIKSLRAAILTLTGKELEGSMAE
jgi:integrase/recombinase XerD